MINGHSVYLLTFELEDLEKVKTISWKFKQTIQYRQWLMPQPMTRKPKMYVNIYVQTYNFGYRIQKISRTLLAFIGGSVIEVFLVKVLGGLCILMIMQLMGDT
jgi:hypothetical protein